MWGHAVILPDAAFENQDDNFPCRANIFADVACDYVAGKEEIGWVLRCKMRGDGMFRDESGKSGRIKMPGVNMIVSVGKSLLVAGQGIIIEEGPAILDCGIL